jgi:hypothetical protein
VCNVVKVCADEEIASNRRQTPIFFQQLRVNIGFLLVFLFFCLKRAVETVLPELPPRRAGMRRHRKT